MAAHVTPAISVVLPAFNSGLYLQEAIQSVVQQTFEDWELVVINDGSSDQTPMLADEWAHRDPRIRVIHLSQNQGLVNALNLGIAQSSAPYIARMDADDRAHAQRLQRQFDFMEQHPEVAICGTAIAWMNHERIIAPPQHHASIVLRLLAESPFAHPTVMLRRSVLDAHHLRYDAQTFPAEDYALWSRLLRIGRGHNLQEVLLDYRVHDAQISSHGNTRQRDAATAVRMESLGYALGRSLSNDESSLLNGVFGGIQTTFTHEEINQLAALLHELSLALNASFGVDKNTAQGLLRTVWWRALNGVHYSNKAQVISAALHRKPQWLRPGLRFYIQTILHPKA